MTGWKPSPQSCGYDQTRTLSRQPTPESGSHLLYWKQLEAALPNHRHTPALFEQFQNNALISFGILVQFAFPKGSIRRRRSVPPTSRMPMPETPMNEDSSLIHPEYEIRFTRQRRIMKTVSEPFRVESTPQRKLRLRVFATNAGHHARTSLLVYNIGHLHLSSAHQHERNGIGL